MCMRIWLRERFPVTIFYSVFSVNNLNEYAPLPFNVELQICSLISLCQNFVEARFG